MSDPNPTSWLQNLGIAIEIVFPALALIVVILRCYIRIDTKCFGWDDGLMVGAMVLSIAMAVGSIKVMKALYIGIHYYDVPQPFDPTEGLIWIYVVGAVYQPILTLVKQSILVFLLRFSGVKAGVRNVVWGTIVFNTALAIAVFVTVIFQCTPIELNWHPLVPGSCIQQFSFGVVAACMTMYVATDIVSLAIPVYVFLGLKMTNKRKAALLGVFLLGGLVTIVSVIRLYFLVQSLKDTSLDANFSLGFTVSSMECNLAILTASAPALWPLIRRWIPHLKSSNGQSYYGHHKYGVDTPHRQQGYIRTTDGHESSIGLKDMNGRRVRTDIRSARDSDEEILTGTGIIRTTQFTVSTEDNYSHAASDRNLDSTTHSKVSSNGSL